MGSAPPSPTVCPALTRRMCFRCYALRSVLEVRAPCAARAQGSDNRAVSSGRRPLPRPPQPLQHRPLTPSVSRLPLLSACCLFPPASFTQKYGFKVLLSFCGLMAHFILLLCNIPLCGWTTVHLSIHLERTYSGSFQFLVIINKDIINISVGFWVDLSFQLLRVTCQAAGLLDCAVSLRLVCKKLPRCPKWPHHAASPAAVGGSSCCSSSSWRLGPSALWMVAVPMGAWWCLLIHDVEPIFSLICHPYLFLSEMSAEIF